MPESPAVPAWRRRERAARRDDLLAAACAEFAERGYHDATVEGIAARAGIGKGSVYLVFEGGKAELLDAILDDHLATLRSLVERTFAHGEGALRYRFWSLALAVTTYFRRRPDLLRIHTREVSRLLADGEGSAAARLARLTDDLVAVVAPAFDAGGASLPAEVAAHHLLSTLFGHVLGLALQPDTTAGALTADAAPVAVADTLTTLVFDGLGAPRPAARGGLTRRSPCRGHRPL